MLSTATSSMVFRFLVTAHEIDPGVRIPLALAALEEFHLSQTLFRFFFRFVRSAHVLSLFGKHFVAVLYFFDHDSPYRRL
jgi:hypothetical protein